MQKKCCFIVPYFGKLPRHFRIFLKTCEYNKEFKWIIFTDDTRKFELPTNVIIKKMSFDELREIVQSKFDFEIVLDRPYKLCDYKPAYGYIFEEYIKDYMFWGHCDLDTIIGNINNFITDDMWKKYDKLFCLGHMILYKNTYENNRLFMKEYKDRLLYKEAFTKKDIAVFDEVCGEKNNINSIFINEGKMVYTKDLSLNIKMMPTKFTKTTYYFRNNMFEVEKYKEAIYLWQKGELFRMYIQNGQIIKEEFLYAHFQQRDMTYSKRILKQDTFKIVPNKFMKLEVDEITKNNFEKIKKKTICFHYMKHLKKRCINKVKKILQKNGEYYVR